MFESLDTLPAVHAAILGVCTAVALAVFFVMLRSIVSFRAAPAARASTLKHKLIEVVWAVIPIVIVAAAAMPAVRPLVAGDAKLWETDAVFVWRL
ncbi:MAG TPA: cytochrome c oxidase subunit II transmembrane domain-containing protein [Steroidobacteraceae bacterium]|jgi:cytochrome c oxidase subunit 2